MIGERKEYFEVTMGALGFNQLVPDYLLLLLLPANDLNI